MGKQILRVDRSWVIATHTEGGWSRNLNLRQIGLQEAIIFLPTPNSMDHHNPEQGSNPDKGTQVIRPSSGLTYHIPSVPTSQTIMSWKAEPLILQRQDCNLLRERGDSGQEILGESSLQLGILTWKGTMTPWFTLLGLLRLASLPSNCID